MKHYHGNATIVVFTLVLTSLRNSSGQTPADVAQAHGFHDCFDLIVSKKLPLGPEDRLVNHNQHHSRKRLLNATDTERMKKAKKVDRKFSPLEKTVCN